MTEQLYRTDPYLRDCTAQVLAINDRGGIVLDRTVFYAAGGGQPGDKGVLETEGGGSCPIATTVYDADKRTIVHVPAEGGTPPTPGQSVRASLDWGFRSPLMRMHTCLHLICALVKFPVTGGQVNPDDSRLDFDIDDPSAVDKDKLTVDLNALIAADHPVSERWISDAELEANPGLIRTMSVKPPMGTGRVRLVLIGEAGAVDMQPAAARMCVARARSAAWSSPGSRRRAS
jgi:misacylated tRNA(Ala) deacylase